MGQARKKIKHCPRGFYLDIEKEVKNMTRKLNKYFVFSDVHGEVDALMASLREAGYDHNNPNHFLVSCGDAFDRGPASREVFDLYLNGRRVIRIKGNHDCFLEEFLDKGSDGEFVLFNILHNGLGATISSFCSTIDFSNPFNLDTLDQCRGIQRFRQVKEMLKDMPLYFETEHFIFCHAGLNPKLPNWKDTDEHFMLWDIEHSCDPIPSTDKMVVIGHHHAFRVKNQLIERGAHPEDITGAYYFNKIDQEQKKILFYGNKDENSPFKHRNKIALDGLTNLTHKVNVMVVEDYPLEEKKDEPTDNNITDAGFESCFRDTTFAVNGNMGNFTYTMNYDVGYDDLINMG